MPLSADQTAMLQLLLDGGRSYEDLAGLLGLDEGEVRSRCRAALAELGGADPDRNVGLSDYLLDQADPIDRADAIRRLKEDPSDHELATRIVSALAEIAPEANLPRLPAQPGGGFMRRSTATTPTGARAPRERSGGARSALSADQTRLLAVLAGAAVILIAVVLALTGVFSGDDEDAADPATTASAGADPETDEPVPIQLEPVGGSDASGVAIFGFTTGDQPYLDLKLFDLQPPADDQAYVMWFLFDEDSGYPIPAGLPVDPEGSYSDRLSVPAEVLAIAQRAQFVDIALVDRQEFSRQIKRAVEGDAEQLPYTGETVLRAELRTAPAAAGDGAPPAGGGGGDAQGAGG